MISKKPDIGRCELSRQICQAWNWKQTNGVLKDMICRGLLLHLEKEGHIKLPPRKSKPINPFLNRQIPEKINIDQSVLQTRLNELKPIQMIQVRRTSLEKLFNSLISQHHYLGYTQPVGEHLKYLFFSKGRVIGCFSWSSAVRHLGSRDRFIGWNAQTRQKNLHLLAYNSRFLIPDWIRVPHLASYLLAQCSKRISNDWLKLYHHPIYFLETFVDTERFKGTCYQAANWIYLGKTTGRGKNDQTGKANRSIKAVWGYPLKKNFKELLNKPEVINSKMEIEIEIDMNKEKRNEQSVINKEISNELSKSSGLAELTELTGLNGSLEQTFSQNNDSKALIGKRSSLYRKLSTIRDILPGSFSTRKVLCGKTNCICKKEGKRHTSYQYSYKIGEKQVTINIPKEYARQVERQVLANKEFNKITRQIHEINLKLLAIYSQKFKHAQHAPHAPHSPRSRELGKNKRKR